jgi:hypothetical protein
MDCLRSYGPCLDRAPNEHGELELPSFFLPGEWQLLHSPHERAEAPGGPNSDARASWTIMGDHLSLAFLLVKVGFIETEYSTT